MHAGNTRRALAIIGLSVLAGCGTDGASRPTPESAAAACPALFRQYDFIESTLSTQSGRRDDVVIRPELEIPAQRLRSAGCLTMTRDLTALDSVPATTFSDSGPQIVPSTLHAGVVTNMDDDARVKAWFEGLGIQVRTIGSPALGRRVYLGPFRTQGGLESATALAREAGFPAPYVKSR